MKINIVAVGHLKEKYLKEAISEYSKRLTRYCDLEIIEVDDEQAPENLSQAQGLQVKKKEAERMLKKMKQGSTLIVLDLKGEQPTSEGLATKLDSFMISGASNLTFILGGSLGLDDELVRMADYRLCMSKMTFPHQLARLILLEQLYRAFKILAGEPYHK